MFNKNTKIANYHKQLNRDCQIQRSWRVLGSLKNLQMSTLQNRLQLFRLSFHKHIARDCLEKSPTYKTHALYIIVYLYRFSIIFAHFWASVFWYTHKVLCEIWNIVPWPKYLRPVQVIAAPRNSLLSGKIQTSKIMHFVSYIRWSMSNLYVILSFSRFSMFLV